MLVADAATTATAAFAAVAALAAWATVATGWVRERAGRQPNVSAGFVDIKETDQQLIEFVNMGPGLAIQLSYSIYASGLRHGGLVGSGHLQAGERQTVNVPIRVAGKTAEFAWACRDIDQRLHVWSYSGKHKRLGKGKYPNMGECFRMMYPDVMLPPRNVGAGEDPTEPG